MKYRHFVFDIDGTLIDTERTGVLSLVRTVEELMGVSMPYEEAYGYFGIPSAKVGPMLGYPEPDRFLERWEENFVEMSYLMKPFDGVEEVLAAVKAAGRTTGCVTSRSRYELEKDEHMGGLLKYIDHVVCAEDSEEHKPSPGPMLAYFRKAAAEPSALADPASCIYIGDTMHDCSCARAAGCDFALADWPGRGLRGIPARYHLTSVSQVLDLL